MPTSLSSRVAPGGAFRIRYRAPLARDVGALVMSVSQTSSRPRHETVMTDATETQAPAASRGTVHVRALEPREGRA